MSKTLAVNKNNDIYAFNGNIIMSVDLLATLQNCEQAAKTQLGELIFQINKGIPNFQTIWNDAGSVLQFEAALRTTLLAVDNVTDIQSLDITIQGNVLFYQAVIVTIFGEGQIGG